MFDFRLEFPQVLFDEDHANYGLIVSEINWNISSVLKKVFERNHTKDLKVSNFVNILLTFIKLLPVNFSTVKVHKWGHRMQLFRK